MGTGSARTSQDPDFDRIRAALVRGVRKACPSDLRPHADDIVQGALTHLLSRVRASDEPLDFGSPYLWRVAHHAVIDEIRRRSRSREESMPEGDAFVARHGDPDASAHDAQITAGLAACLRAAGPDRRAALGLYLQGMSIPEIARALGWNTKRAENLVYRGLTGLRKCMLAKGLRP